MKYKNNIDQLKKLTGLTYAQIAEQSGISLGYLNEIKRGDKYPRPETLEKLASVFQCTTRDIFEDTVQVPVIGEVGAGAEVFPIDDLPLMRSNGVGERIKPTDPVEAIDPPPGTTGRGLVALRIRGDSWMPYLREGSIVFYENRDKPPSQCIGEKVVVKVKDGPTLFKVLKRSPMLGRYNLISPNAVELEDIEVEWCAIVTDISSRGRL